MNISSICWVAGLAASLNAAERADKSQYHLLNPTPRELMREMSTDRPDKTESAYTVDAGHFQIESDLVAFSFDHDTSGGADTRATDWTAGTLNLKAGLCNFSDLQVILSPYSRLRSDDRIAGTINRQSGFGDIITRLKVSLWGNDGGACAGAIMPYVKWPASQNNIGNSAIEGGVIVPVGFELPGGWSSAVMTEIDWVRDSAGADYHPEFVNSITFAHDIVGNLAGFVEFFSLASAENGVPWEGTLDLGLTYAISENVQLDGGIYIGVTKSAPDWSPFLGFSVRF